MSWIVLNVIFVMKKQKNLISKITAESKRKVGFRSTYLTFLSTATTYEGLYLGIHT